MLLRSRSYVARLYIKKGLSENEMAKQLNVNRAAVKTALRNTGLLLENRENARKAGRTRFGHDYVDGEKVKNPEEQKIIRMARQMRTTGKSLRDISKKLNEDLIPTKHGGVWQANTVRKILA